MRMKVWGEISGERHLVGTLETIPGREEQFSYAESEFSRAAQHRNKPARRYFSFHYLAKSLVRYFFVSEESFRRLIIHFR